MFLALLLLLQEFNMYKCSQQILSLSSFFFYEPSNFYRLSIEQSYSFVLKAPDTSWLPYWRTGNVRKQMH